MNYTEYMGGCVNFGMSKQFLKDYLLEYGKNYNLELMRTHSTAICYFIKLQNYRVLSSMFNRFKMFCDSQHDFELVSHDEFAFMDDLPA